MDEILIHLTHAMQGSAAVALIGALLWGVTSVMLSPCHLGTIPLVVAYVGGEPGKPRTHGSAASLSFAFAGGMLLALALLGGLVSAAGWAVGGWARYTNYVVAVIFLAAGLDLIGLLPLPQTGLSIANARGKGVLAAGLWGLILGVGLSPCTFAFLAPVLALSFGSGAANSSYGMALLVAFGIGHCGVIGLAGTSADKVQRYLDWNDQSRGPQIVKAICGALLIGACATLIYSA